MRGFALQQQQQQQPLRVVLHIERVAIIDPSDNSSLCVLQTRERKKSRTSNCKRRRDTGDSRHWPQLTEGQRVIEPLRSRPV